jgi:hypothetical protein
MGKEVGNFQVHPVAPGSDCIGIKYKHYLAAHVAAGMYANPALDLGKRTMAEQVWENVEAIIAASPVEPVASD